MLAWPWTSEAAETPVTAWGGSCDSLGMKPVVVFQEKSRRFLATLSTEVPLSHRGWACCVILLLVMP